MRRQIESESLRPVQNILPNSMKRSFTILFTLFLLAGHLQAEEGASEGMKSPVEAILFH